MTGSAARQAEPRRTASGRIDASGAEALEVRAAFVLPGDGTGDAQPVNELVEAADERRLSRLFAPYGRLDPLCLDELGYVKLDDRGAELLFQILTEREERATVASNLPFSEWGGIIDDPRLVAGIVDRLTFNAHILETGSDSCRLRLTRERDKRLQ